MEMLFFNVHHYKNVTDRVIQPMGSCTLLHFWKSIKEKTFFSFYYLFTGRQHRQLRRCLTKCLPVCIGHSHFWLYSFLKYFRGSYALNGEPRSSQIESANCHMVLSGLKYRQHYNGSQGYKYTRNSYTNLRGNFIAAKSLIYFP